MDQSELLCSVVSILERLRVPYLVTGSIATIYYGEPRFTNDLDLVVQLQNAQIAAFCSAFPAAAFYLDEESVRQAVDSHGQFNVIHPASGLKVDFMIPADTPFNRSRFGRAIRAHPVAECEVNFAAPEDVIIKKLEYFRDGGSEKHLRDITGMLKISAERINRAYIAEWAARLGLSEVWQAVLASL
jgi:hypothetical protein